MASRSGEVREYYLEVAGEDLDEALLLLENQKYCGAVSRAYYSIFNSARALLHAKGVTSKTNRGLIREFGKKLVKTGEIPQDYGAMLSRAQSMRREADYEVMTDIGFEDAKSVVEDAEKFLKMAKRGSA